MAIVAKYLRRRYLLCQIPANKAPKFCRLYASHYHGARTVAPCDNVEPLCIWVGGKRGSGQPVG
jgi:hypothetical protein